MQVVTSEFECPAVTGDHTINVGFQPKMLEFLVSQKQGSGENDVAHLSIGWTDGEEETAHCTFARDNAAFTRKYTNYCVAHLMWNSGGTWIERRISATFKNWTSTGAVITFDNVDANFDISVKAIG